MLTDSQVQREASDLTPLVKERCSKDKGRCEINCFVLSYWFVRLRTKVRIMLENRERGIQKSWSIGRIGRLTTERWIRIFWPTGRIGRLCTKSKPAIRPTKISFERFSIHTNHWDTVNCFRTYRSIQARRADTQDRVWKARTLTWCHTSKQIRNSHTWSSNPKPITSPFPNPREMKHLLLPFLWSMDEKRRVRVLVRLRGHNPKCRLPRTRAAVGEAMLACRTTACWGCPLGCAHCGHGETWQLLWRYLHERDGMTRRCVVCVGVHEE
jgi:hypothetical protein